MAISRRFRWLSVLAGLLGLIGSIFVSPPIFIDFSAPPTPLDNLFVVAVNLAEPILIGGSLALLVLFASWLVGRSRISN
jgi:hypothetical protein